MRARLAVGGAAAVALLASVAVGGAATKSSTTTVAVGDHGLTDVRCKKGQRVVAANARGESEDPLGAGPLVVLGEISRPGKRRVEVSGANLGSGSGELTAIARCKKQPKSKPESESVPVAPAGMTLEVESVSAKCPRGKRIVFGGFRAEQRPEDDPDSPIVIPIAAEREGARSWTVRGFNFADGPDDAGELESLVYCGEVKKTEAHTATVVTDSFENGNADARCPQGTKLRYGGFEGTAETDGVSFITGLERLDNRTLRVSQFAFSGDPIELTAIAYCR